MSSGRYSLLILVDRLIRLSVSLVPIHTHAHLLLRTFRFVRSGARDNQIETNQTNRNNFTFIRTQAGPTTTRSKLTRTWRCSTLSCRRHQAPKIIPGHRSVIESLNLSPVHDPPVVPRLEVGLEDQIQQDRGKHFYRLIATHRTAHDPGPHLSGLRPGYNPFILGPH